MSSVTPMIGVGSVDAARDFYVEKLGFQHAMGMVGKDGQLDFVSVIMGPTRVMLTRAPGTEGKPGAKQPVELYIEVDNVDAYHAVVKKNGVSIADPLTQQWWGDKTFKVMDPNGYLIWFFTTVAEPAPPQGVKIV